MTTTPRTVQTQATTHFVNKLVEGFRMADHLGGMDRISALHGLLVHPHGDTCPDGCDKAPDQVALAVYTTLEMV